jgi:hypothetical protein
MQSARLLPSFQSNLLPQSCAPKVETSGSYEMLVMLYHSVSQPVVRDDRTGGPQADFN